MSDLTEKQQLFINAYLLHFNATRAAIEAGYSEEAARTEGWRLLKNADIKQVVDDHIKEVVAQTDDKRADLIKFWQKMKDDEDLSAGIRLKASENLAKYLAMFTERIEHSGNMVIEDTVFVIETREIS